MGDPPTERPVLEYAGATNGRPLLHVMMSWRVVCFWCSLGTIARLILLPRVGAAIATAPLLAAIASGVLSIVYMARAARAEAGGVYAARHVAPAVALFPILFLGVWVVPVLVESDLIKWREAEDKSPDNRKINEAP